MNQAPRVILHVFPSQSWGGAEIYSVQLANAQKAAGENVVYWAHPGSRIAEAVQKQGIQLITEKLGYRLDVSLWRILRVLTTTKATHVHLHWSGGMWSLGLAKVFRDFKLILQAHLWMKHTKKDPLHWLLYKNLDILIVAGEEARQAAASCLPLDKTKIQICPYAIETGQVVPVVRESQNIKAEDLVFGIFSRLDRQKGILEFLRAFAAPAKANSDLKLLIVGDATHGEVDSMRYSEELKEFVAENFVDGVVQFHGFKKNFRDWLALCDVLAVPSYHESYSLMILEAFSVGIPVLSTNAGGTPDLIHNERGWLVEPRDVESLSAGLEQVLRERHQLRAKGLMAMQYVHNHHTFSRVVARLSEIY